MTRRFIAWMARRTDWLRKHPLTDWDTQTQVAVRYMPFWRDEYIRGDRKHRCRPPWWRPFNVLLHVWRESDDGDMMHDHPRWSITICLKGQLTELTPWGDRVLTAGSIVFRGHKSIHGFRVLKEHGHRTWTLFIVGRRNHPQNTYRVQRRENP